MVALSMETSLTMDPSGILTFCVYGFTGAGHLGLMTRLMFNLEVCEIELFLQLILRLNS